LNDKDKMHEEIWELEAAYFTNLYNADYAAVLALIHPQFLGWPDGVPHPLDKQGCARFMQQLIPAPTACTFTIERGGMRVLGDVALTQYTINVHCSDPAGLTHTQASRITHTWVKEGEHWKLLGGMSCSQLSTN